MKAFFAMDSRANSYYLLFNPYSDKFNEIQSSGYLHYFTGINIHFSTKNMFGPVITTIINAIPE